MKRKYKELKRKVKKWISNQRVVFEYILPLYMFLTDRRDISNPPPKKKNISYSFWDFSSIVQCSILTEEKYDRITDQHSTPRIENYKWIICELYFEKQLQARPLCNKMTREFHQAWWREHFIKHHNWHIMIYTGGGARSNLHYVYAAESTKCNFIYVDYTKQKAYNIMDTDSNSCTVIEVWLLKIFFETVSNENTTRKCLFSEVFGFLTLARTKASFYDSKISNTMLRIHPGNIFSLDGIIGNR